jgi:hypothetical protein
MATTAKRAKAHATLRKTIDEPMLDQDNYNVSLTSALVWYRDNLDEKKIRKFAIEYFAKLGKKKEVLAINKAGDYDVRQLGVLCRLVSNGNALSDDHMKTIDNMVTHIFRKEALPQKIKEDKTIIVPVAAPSIQERMEEKAHDLAGEIEGAIDDFVLNKCKSDFSTKNYLLANQVAGPIAKRIGEIFVHTAEEIREAIEGNDDQLVEGYSHLNKRELKRFAEFVEGIIADCQQQVQTAKANRAPRKRKAASPTKVVSKMKFLRDFAEFNLKSCKPEDILTSTELWVYNTKYRKVTVYKSDGGTLSVKGTTILGFDIKESKTMTLRKPEEFFKGLAMGKRALNGAFKKLTTKPSVPNGRVNEECVLLGAF